jgi:hypothetical protein
MDKYKKQIININFNNHHKECQTYSGELTSETTVKIAENAETANAKWASSESMTFSSAENASENTVTSLDSLNQDDQILIVYKSYF